jgi:hypothetical protein
MELLGFAVLLYVVFEMVKWGMGETPKAGDYELPAERLDKLP